MPYFSDEERAAAWERAHAALDRCDESRREHEAWLAEREERRLRGYVEREVPEAPQPAPATPRASKRPAEAPRDWQAEEQWIARIANDAIDHKLKVQIAPAIGEAISELVNRATDAVRAEFMSRLEDLRNELRAATASAALGSELLDRLSRIALMIDQMSVPNGDGSHRAVLPRH